MSTPSELIPLLGPVAAATVTGSVAFLASVLSKESKTSEFRQAWVDALRQDISDLVSIVLMTDDTIAHMRRTGRDEEIAQYIIDHHEQFTKVTSCGVRIELRLNPDEDKKLLSLVRAVGTSTKTFQGDTDALAQHADNLLAESQVVLKREWRRVKRGETVYLATKWLSLFIAVVAIGIGVVATAGHVTVRYVP